MWEINVYEPNQPSQPSQPTQPSQPPSSTNPPTNKPNALYILGAVILALLGVGVYKISKSKR